MRTSPRWSYEEGDRSFVGYLRSMRRQRGSTPRALAVVAFATALLISGVLITDVEIVGVVVLGLVAVGYVVWRHQGRTP
jgi:hypothetical protein